VTRNGLAGAVLAVALAVVAAAVGYRALHGKAGRSLPGSEGSVPTAPAAAEPPPASAEPRLAAAPESSQGFLYGRITTVDGATHEGRLRWGGNEEAFWGDTFNGVKRENPWLARVPPEQRPTVRHQIEVFAFVIAAWDRAVNVERRFMARFGDIARIEAYGREVRVTLKSGTSFVLDRFNASDFDDGLRVWDDRQGEIDFDSMQIRSIELLPTPALAALPARLHGTVRTKQGEFTGFVRWDRDECVGSDTLDGRAGESEVSLRFDAIRSIERREGDSALVTLLDGREVLLSDEDEVGRGNRGIYVEDPRYGRVLISWDAFERIDFSPAGSGPGYGDFPPGRPLTGGVTTRSGDRVAGRLVYDLDESESVETLDAPADGVDYTIPFGLVASIALAGPEERGTERVGVTLHGGEALQLERSGDLGERNAGVLVFAEGRQQPEYVPFAAIARIDFDPPPADDPPSGGPSVAGPGRGEGPGDR
jgi:hypothetical protein